MSIEAFTRFFRTSKQAEVRESALRTQENWKPVTGLRSIKDTIDLLKSKQELSPAVTREVVFRMFKAVGESYRQGKLSLEFFSEIEKVSREFYLRYYQYNELDTSSVLASIESLPSPSEIIIENTNRNLTSLVWEPIIYSKAKDLQQQIDVADKCMIVSVAWGASEPALLVSGLLNRPIIHIKCIDDQTFVIESEAKLSELQGKDVIIVEDVTRSGKGLQRVKQVVEQYQPINILTAVIKQY